MYAVKIFLALFLSFFVSINAITTKEVFAKYPNKYFIETGSFRGDGIQMAKSVGFERIFSIELAPHYYEYCKNLFSYDPSIMILQGDSTYVLPILLQSIDEPATFWLDGHYSSGISSGQGEKNCPLIAELEAIKQHPIKSHTILIDDVRCLGTEHFDFLTLNEVIAKLLEINPGYKISFEDGYVQNDVLVATIY